MTSEHSGRIASFFISPNLYNYSIISFNYELYLFALIRLVLALFRFYLY